MRPTRRWSAATWLAASVAAGTPAIAAPDLYSDTWAATDGLHRRLPLSDELRVPQPGKVAGIFYFLWHGSHGTPGPYDISKILSAGGANPQWGPATAFHWWGEPEAGYYLATDPWVIRRNLSMLSDAGIDVLFLDVTNAATYPKAVEALCGVAMAMRAEGNVTPQIAFVTNAHGAETVDKLYEEFYRPAKFRELWFLWQGKPLLLGQADWKTASGEPLRPEVQNYFTWRYSWAWKPGARRWQWLDEFPQRPGYEDDPTKVEELPVAVASHPTNNRGRSYQNKNQPEADALGMTSTFAQGYHFAEQWKRALEVDPPLVFVTGWNEWVAQRFVVKPGQKMNFLGRSLAPGETYFVDAYSAEYSRDIEPMKGGYGDAYYYQMVANLRRFKGARPVPTSGPPQTIKVDGRFDDWRGVVPEYHDTVGDTAHRDAPGWGSLAYRDMSGRNDIVAARVARNAGNVYFTARTRDTLSPPTDANWMMLFIDSDSNPNTGWNGFDLRANARRVASGQVSVELWHKNAWQEIPPSTMATSGNQLELALPRRLFARSGTTFTFDFKWVDNANPDELESWFVQGDSAPNRRFNYRFLALP